MDNEFEFPKDQVNKVMEAVHKVIKLYINHNLCNAKFYLIFMPDLIYYKDDF